MLEDYAASIAIIAAVMGSIMSLSYFSQVYRILKRKSVEDLSLTLFIIFFIGMIVWILYGLSVNSYPVIIANIIGLVGAGTIIALYFKYKR